MKAPAYLSRPHFDKADSYYARQFQVGIHPETEKHESYFLIEPHTSVPLEVTNLTIRSLHTAYSAELLSNPIIAEPSATPFT